MAPKLLLIFLSLFRVQQILEPRFLVQHPFLPTSFRWDNFCLVPLYPIMTHSQSSPVSSRSSCSATFAKFSTPLTRPMFSVHRPPIVWATSLRTTIPLTTPVEVHRDITPLIQLPLAHRRTTIIATRLCRLTRTTISRPATSVEKIIKANWRSNRREVGMRGRRRDQARGM